MSDPHDMPIGGGGDVDALDGYLSYLGRSSETEWFAGRYVGGALVKLGIIEETAAPELNWVVRPVSPLYDVDEYDSWDGARRAAFRLDPPF
jgi:hypothetical protein